MKELIGTGFLRVDDFRGLLDRNPGVRSVELSNRGEPFLNPRILDLLRVAWERGVEVTFKTGANLNDVEDDVLEGLVKYGVRDLTCSIDGASQETYVLYRRKGDFGAVLENLRKIAAHKKRYRSPYPRMVWQFVVFGHNEHEIAEARALAAELGMTFFPKLSWDGAFSPIRDASLVRRETGKKAISRAEHTEEKNAIYMGDICEQLWEAPQINHDGRVLGCCVNYEEEFGGNAFEDLHAAMNGEKLTYAREMLLGKAPPRDDVPCGTCPNYFTRKRLGVWVDLHEPKKVLKRLAKRARSRIDAVRHRWALMRTPSRGS